MQRKAALPSRLRLKQFDDQLWNLKWKKEQAEKKIKQGPEHIEWLQEQETENEAIIVQAARENSEAEAANKKHLAGTGIEGTTTITPTSNPI